jgi:PAT family beta-lactamase induction signal transducer AmpG
MTTDRRIRPAELALAVCLYSLQGVVVAYLLNFNKSYMIAGGVEERIAGRVETAVLLVLVLKFLLGPLSDRFNPLGLGHRRPFIVVGLIAQSCGLVGLSVVNSGSNLLGFAAMAYLAVIGLALYDTCCDGLVVDVTPPDDRVRVQGLLQVARFVATMICTWGFGQWMAGTGIGPGRSAGVLWTCAGLGVLPLMLALFVRERARPADAEAFSWSALRSLGRPKALVLLAFGALYGMIGLGIEFNLSLYYDHLGYQLDGIGSFSAIRYAGRAVGALLLPVLKSRLGRRGELITGLLALALTTVGQATIEGPTSAGFWAFTFGMANGWNDALFCVLAMEASDPRMAASTFAVYMAVSNLSVVGDALFLEAVHLWNGQYRPVLLVSAVLVLGLLAMVRPLSRLRSEEPSADADL